jgi:hypothetical protein
MSCPPQPHRNPITIVLITRFTSLNEGFSTEVRAILLYFCVAHSRLVHRGDAIPTIDFVGLSALNGEP